MSHRGGGSCKSGTMQLTPEVKSFIDSEVGKSNSQRPAMPGLKELTTKLLAAETQLAEIQNLRSVYTQSFTEFSKAVKTLSDRRRRIEKELNEWTTGARTYAIRQCNKPKKAKKK